MIKTNSVFVVEGQSDKALLSRFFDTEIVITNGTYVSRETKDYLMALEKTHDIVVITDPDGPGNQIRQTLLAVLNNPKVALTDKKRGIKKGKVGIAETDIEHLLEVVTPLVSPAKDMPPALNLTDLLTLQVKNPAFYQILVQKYPLKNTNKKTMIKRLKYLGVTKQEIEDLIHG